MKYLKTYIESQAKQRDWSTILNKRRSLISNRYIKASKRMNQDKAIDFILENCKEWVENPVDIRRGISMEYDFFYSKPVTRLSRDCRNYYTLIMDNAPEWKDYPKRSKSFICSLGDARMGGNIFNVIPLDGSKWGIASSDDIYDSFEKGLSRMGFKGYTSMSEIMTTFYTIAEKYYGIEVSDSNWAQFKKDLKKIEKIAKTKELEIYFDFDIYINMDKNIMKSQNILKSLIDIINPIDNNFTFCEYSELSKIHRGDECWTDSPCVFIKNNWMPLKDSKGNNIYGTAGFQHIVDLINKRK